MDIEFRSLKNLEELMSDLLSNFPERELYMLDMSGVITESQPYRGRPLDWDRPEDLFYMVLFELLHATEETKFKLARIYNIE